MPDLMFADRKLVAANIKRLRRALGLSQGDFGLRLSPSASPPVVCTLELGHHLSMGVWVERIAAAYRIPVEVLLRPPRRVHTWTPTEFVLGGASDTPDATGALCAQSG